MRDALESLEISHRLLEAWSRLPTTDAEKVHSDRSVHLQLVEKALEFVRKKRGR